MNDALTAANEARILKMRLDALRFAKSGLRTAAQTKAHQALAAGQGTPVKVFNVTGPAIAVGVGVVSAVGEAQNAQQTTTAGTVVTAAAAGTLEALPNFNPVTNIASNVSGIVDNVVDLTATYAEVDIKAPKAVEVMKNTGRVLGAAVDGVASGNTRGMERLVERWKSGELGSASKKLAELGEGLGDAIWSLCGGDELEQEVRQPVRVRRHVTECVEPPAKRRSGP